LGIKAGYTILDGASANMSGNYTITDTATAQHDHGEGADGGGPGRDGDEAV